MPTTRPYDAGDELYEHRRHLSRSFVPLALITIGVVFLLGNFIPDRARSGLIVLGLGVAFLVGRVATGRYGYAVPGGLLVAIGAYIGLQSMSEITGARGPGLFFVLLGLGFLLVYVAGSRPSAVWPLFPAIILICLGLVPFGLGLLAPLASLSWIGGYWPLVLVLLGLWLLFRDHLPDAARKPVATLGGVLLLGYGLLAAAATVGNAGAFARVGFAPMFGTAAINDTVTLDQPIAAAETVSVANTSGKTTIHGGTGSTVHVVANRHYSVSGHAPDVRLTPTSGGVSVDASAGDGFGSFFDGASFVDYTIDVPEGVNVQTQADSGKVEVSAIRGNVQAAASSGTIDLNDIGGDVRASTSSGGIHASQLAHVRSLVSNSGAISVDGRFTEQASIQTSSGAVNVKLLPDSAIRLEAKSSSGRVTPSGLSLTDGVTTRDALSGAIGNPANAAVLSIQTSSGSISVGQ